MPYPTGSESVEVLVRKTDFEMEDNGHYESTTCGMLDCFSARAPVRRKAESLAHKRASKRIGVEREMRVTYNQPHLVEPMKLTVYAELPATPVVAQQPSHVSRFVHQSKRSISRASTRASLATKRRTPKSSISNPIQLLSPNVCQLRRNPSFRPLQLSIYNDDNRLSDLPEFDALSFTSDGEIQFPAKALIRTQSEDMLRPRGADMSVSATAKPASMFEQSLSRRMSHIRQHTESTIVSSSRPASEYDALHSHPVTWFATPGIPTTMQFATAPTISKTILSPMQEEFTPPPSGAVIINGRVLAFPNISPDRSNTATIHQSINLPTAPSPTLDPGPNRRTTLITRHQAKISESASIMLASSNNSVRTRAATLERQTQAANTGFHSHSDSKTTNRVNQWLESDSGNTGTITTARPRESSISTIKSTSTTLSFAEHRRKRSQFYQLNQTQPTQPEQSSEAPVTANKSTTSCKTHKAPTPLTLYTPFPPKSTRPPTRDRSNSTKSHVHARTQTVSTVASTVATDLLFDAPETPDLVHETRKAYDAESMTTVDMKSRTGTMKSTATAASAHEAAAEFRFRGNTPSPAPDSPQTPLSAKTKDVEKLMFEMCASSGLRRVNVGVAF